MADTAGRTFRRPLLSIASAALLAFSTAALLPAAAHAQWWGEEEWAEDYDSDGAVFEDDESYEDYDEYYGEDWEDEEWGDWFS